MTAPISKSASEAASWAVDNGMGYVARSTLEDFAQHVIHTARQKDAETIEGLAEQLGTTCSLCVDAEYIIRVRLGHLRPLDDYETNVLEGLRAIGAAIAQLKSK